MEIIKKITSPSTEVVYMGDPNQASTGNCEIFQRLIESEHPTFLQTNYRSSAAIVDLLNDFGEACLDNYNIQFAAEGCEEGEFAIFHCEQPYTLAAKYVAEFAQGSTFVFSNNPKEVQCACSLVGRQIRIPNKLSANEDYVMLPQQSRGMERPQVIIIGDWPQRELYVAMSRAKTRVIFINPPLYIENIFGVEKVSIDEPNIDMSMPFINDYIVSFDVEGRGKKAQEVGAIAYKNGVIIDTYDSRRTSQVTLAEWDDFNEWLDRHKKAKFIRWAGSDHRFACRHAEDISKWYVINQQRLGITKPPHKLCDAAEVYVPYINWTPHVAIDDARVTLEVYLQISKQKDE